MEDGPKLGDVGGEGDVGVQHDDLLEVRGQRFGQHQLHEPMDARVVLIGDPGHFRLGRGREGEREREGEGLVLTCHLLR